MPSDGLKRFKAGDSGWFVKFVRVLPIDTVCAAGVTGAWSELMLGGVGDRRIGGVADKPVFA